MRVKTLLIRYKQTQFVRDRITQLRLKKGVSEYQMSYDLGHSRSYVYNISSGKSLPPMAEFLQICNYFDITPSQFFDESEENAQNRIRQLMAERGWTIYRLAQESGLSQTTISNIFKRNNQPSLPTVNAICEACGIKLAQFFTENEPVNVPNAQSELNSSVASLREDQREALAAFIKTMV